MSRRYLSHHPNVLAHISRAQSNCSKPSWAYEGDVCLCPCCGTVFAIQCCVPGCGRTRGNGTGNPPIRLSRRSSWICSRHWAGIPAPMRYFYRRAQRRHDRLQNDNSRNAERRLWRVVRRVAIERGVGI